MFKIIGIIAVAAVIGFSAVSCGPDGIPINNYNNNSNPDVGAPLRIPVEVPFVVTDELTWAAAAGAIKIGGDNQSYIINITQDFELAGLSLTANTFEPSNITVIINGKDSDGNDVYHTISLKKGTQGGLFRIGSKQTVVINNIGLIGHSNNNSELVCVEGGAAANVNNDDAVFTMKGGSSVKNNKGGDDGSVSVVRGTFNMEDSAEVSNNTCDSGPGGVKINGGFFTMKDLSSIYNNTSVNDAAGVRITSGAVFNMLESASINGNVTDAEYGDGGGVAVTSSGTFNMKDNAVIYNNSAGIGGGVYLNASGGASCVFNMYDNSKISGNTSKKNGVEYGGGGVYSAHNCAFRVISGTVYGNGIDVTPANLKNQITGAGATGAALKVYGTTGTAERGTYNSAGKWVSYGALTTTDNTINVVNEAAQ